MKWITRERPKIDRIACPWLIKKFIDADTEFIYVPKEQVFQKERLSFEERITKLTKELESSKNAAIKQQQDLDNQIQRQRNNLQTQMEEKKELQKQKSGIRIFRR